MIELDNVDFPGAEPMPSEDVLDQPDTISIEELEELEYDQLSAAGVDPQTPVDTFLKLQGDKAYVTEM